jgi:hypothetical protein
MSPQLFLEFLQVRFKGSGGYSIYMNSLCIPDRDWSPIANRTGRQNTYLGAIKSLRYVSER